jgi:hypothetical protein
LFERIEFEWIKQKENNSSKKFIWLIRKNESKFQWMYSKKKENKKKLIRWNRKYFWYGIIRGNKLIFRRRIKYEKKQIKKK